MVRVLFWNAGTLDLTNDLLLLCGDLEPEIIVLAEPWDTIDIVIPKLSALGLGAYVDVSGTSQRIKMYTRLSFSSIENKADSHTFTLKRVTPPMGNAFLLGAVHLPSKMHYKEVDQLQHASIIAGLLTQAEVDEGHYRTLLIGDFNMDPFESGMVGANAFHAVMDRRIAQKGTRKVQGQHFRFFYNPMWSRLGDQSAGPPGTLKYASSGYTEYFWRTFDQVLIRPDLLDRISDANVNVIYETANTKFIRQNGKWACPSDHLPVAVSVNP